MIQAKEKSEMEMILELEERAKPPTDREIAQLLEWTIKQMLISPTFYDLRELTECLLVKLNTLSVDQAAMIVHLARNRKANPRSFVVAEDDDEIITELYEVSTETNGVIAISNEVKPKRRGNAKLSDEIVLEIYHATGTQKEIGKRLGVRQNQVSAIKRGDIWSQLTGHGRKTS